MNSPLRAASAPAKPAPKSGADGLYQAFWRWHFYAGLIVMPVLMLMALTGGLYLFQPEIEASLYRPLLKVEASGQSLPPQAWADAALKAIPGRLAQVSLPAADTQSVKLVIERPGGARRDVFVDPHSGRVLGDIADGGVMAVVKSVHSLSVAGPIANLLVEMAAGWAIVMVATGVVLWWPRGARGGVVSIRARPAKRLFWRDLHAVTGAFTGLVIVFLAATGMPWSAFWGKEVRALTTGAGWGRPAAPTVAPEHAHHEAAAAVPWALEGKAMANMPAMAPKAPLTLDAAVSQVDGLGLARPYVLSLPRKSGGVWTASYMPAKVENTRTLYLAGSADASLLADIGYGRFGPAAKAIEWGISVHQGRQFGQINRLIMLAGCVAVWLLGISALVMWWKRRPRAGLGAPLAPADRRGYRALALVVVPLGLLYPLVGLSMVVGLSADLAVRRFVRTLSGRP